MPHPLNKTSFPLYLIFAACAFSKCAEANTVIRHRAVVDQTEPDLSNETRAVISSQDNQGTLRLRCQPEKGLSVEMLYRRYFKNTDSKDRLEMSYWTEEGSKSEDKAWSVGTDRAILPNGRQILDDALKSTTMHVQIGAAAPMIFKPKGLSNSLAKMQSDCPSDALPPDQNGLAK